MQVKATYQNIWAISYPIMLGALAQTVLGLTDTAFLARVGEVELGASAIAGVFYFVLVMLGMSISIGAQIMMSRRAGENNRQGIGFIFDHAIIILFSMSVILFLMMQFVAPAFFKHILKSEAIYQASVTFIYYRSFGIFFILLTNCFRSFYTSISLTKVITYNAILLTSLNIFLAYAMIFGHFGFKAEGIAGAGKASAIAELCSLVYMVIYTALKKDIKSFGLFRFKGMLKKMYADLLNISSPIFFQNLVSMGAWFLFFVFIESIGQHELAISNVVRSAYMVLMTPIWGYSSATNSMVSNLMGQKKEHEVLGLIRKIVIMSLATTACMFLINLINYRFILELTSSDVQLVNHCMASYNMVWAGMFIFSASIVMLMGVSGTGKTKVTMMIEVFNIFIYMVYVYVTAVVIHTQLQIVWAAEIIYWFIMAVCAYLYLRSGKWKT